MPADARFWNDPYVLGENQRAWVEKTFAGLRAAADELRKKATQGRKP